MACCEYTCRECNHTWFANGAKACPECGSENLHVFYDESDAPDYPDDHQPEEDFE